MVSLPHTNTVILLERYCGTITEPGWPVVYPYFTRKLAAKKLDSLPFFWPENVMSGKIYHTMEESRLNEMH